MTSPMSAQDFYAMLRDVPSSNRAKAVSASITQEQIAILITKAARGEALKRAADRWIEKTKIFQITPTPENQAEMYAAGANLFAAIRAFSPN